MTVGACMTSVPPDLSNHRQTVLRVTGLPGNAVGIAPNQSHKKTGGYHCSRADCAAIGKFHGPATSRIGSRTEDYSVRLLRDRVVTGDDSAALDVGSEWRNGGRAAWLRYNHLLVADLRAGNPALAAIRAVNVTLDGHTKLRFDREHGFAQESSADTVDGHTHHELYRDTVGRRQPTFDRLTQLMVAAIAGAAPAPTPTQDPEDDMTGWNTPLGQGPVGEHYAKEYPATALAWLWKGQDNAQAALATLLQQVTDLTTAIAAFAAGGSNADTGAIIAAINARTSDLAGLVTAQGIQIDTLHKQLDAVLTVAEANLSPAELEMLHAAAAAVPAAG